MGADATLVQGAYDTTKYTKAGVDKSFNRFGNTLVKGVASIAKNQKAKKVAEEKKVAAAKAIEDKKLLAQEELEAKRVAAEEAENEKVVSKFDETASKVAENAGALSTDDYSTTYDIVTGEHLRGKFVEGDAKTRGMVMSAMNNLSTDISNFKESRLRLSDNWNSRSKKNGVVGTGFSRSLSDSDRDYFSEVIEDESSIITEEVLGADGEVTGIKVGVLGPDGEFMSFEALDNMIASNEVDVKSQLSMKQLVSAKSKEASIASHDDVFDIEAVGRSVQSIVSGGNMKSLMYDPMFGGTSFVDDLYSSNRLTGMKYSDLGISNQEAYELDANKDGVLNDTDNLSTEDLDSVIKQFIESPDQEKSRQDMLVKYLTHHVEKTWAKKHKVVVDKYNKDNNIKPNSSNVDKTPLYTDEQMKTNQQIIAEDRNKNGGKVKTSNWEG